MMRANHVCTQLYGLKDGNLYLHKHVLCVWNKDISITVEIAADVVWVAILYHVHA